VRDDPKSFPNRKKTLRKRLYHSAKRTRGVE
jgi:hypothetical protein